MKFDLHMHTTESDGRATLSEMAEAARERGLQYIAITVPFWDHCELGRLMIRIHDQGFHASDLWAPHNHTRPAVYRAVLLANAWLTDWDIRSEYIYLVGSLYAAFLILAYGLWIVAGRRMSTRYLGALAVLSMFSFSPVAHNNHWWSMMTQLPSK